MKGTKAIVVLTALAAVGGCAGGPTSTTTTRTPTSTPPATSASAPLTTPTRQVAATTSSAALSTAGWTTGPTTVTHQPSVPPVPVVTGIRYAAHKEGFDRIVLDIPGSLPGYSVKYVPEVRRDGSDEPVSIPGEAFLLIVLNPAQAHRADGTPTVTGIHRTGLAGIKSYAVVGDYEGYVSIALGLNGVRKYHVGELSNRIYLDVAV